MIPFPYQFKLKGHYIRGKLYSHTGTYIGGKQTIISSRNAFEKIAVRNTSGRVRIAHINDFIDPPDNCTITLFYFRHGRRLRLFQIYIHETDNFHRVSADAVDDMIAATLRIGMFRRAWSQALPYILWMLIALFALIASCTAYYHGDDSLLTIFSTAIVSVFLLLLRGPLINQLGGTQRITAAMKARIKPLSRRLINALAKQQQQRRQQKSIRLTKDSPLFFSEITFTSKTKVMIPMSYFRNSKQKGSLLT